MNGAIDKKISAVSDDSNISGDATIVNSVIGDRCAVKGKAIIENSVALPDSCIDGVHIRNAVVMGDRVYNIECEK